jgi:hypothetical protein
MENTADKNIGSTSGPATKPSVMREFPKPGSTKKGFKVPMFLVVILVVLAGIGTGWFLSGNSSAPTSKLTQTTQSGDSSKVEDEVGVLEKGVEYEEVEGKLAEGGINGEGTHHLVRDEKRPDQNVYLTSSTLDLQSYVGKNVKIWGITISGQKAGWLMEAGKISVQD